MTPARTPIRTKTITLRWRRAGAAVIGCIALAACSSKGGDPARQYGPDPYLPEPHDYLLPPMSVPKAIGWNAGELPTVAAGLKVEAIATGLEHPRTVHTLPNGDILVVESNSPGTEALRPKDFIAGKVKGLAGAGAKGGNRITLLRDSGPGQGYLKTVFIEHLRSPYGVALVGDTLYVANTDAVLAFHYVPGATQITSPGIQLTDLPAGPIDHHWTKSMTVSADGSKLYVGVGSNSNITENGMAVEEGRAGRAGRSASMHPARATPPAWPSSRRRIACSRSSTNATRSVPISSRIISPRFVTAGSMAGPTATGEVMSMFASILSAPISSHERSSPTTV
jgi:glucose/arabinose dehydrogenase